MNRAEIEQILPHRKPMLLVDEAVLNEDGTATGFYTVQGNEFFGGHFPGNPVVPGVILCEMMAQTCCVMLAGKAQGKTPISQALIKCGLKPGQAGGHRTLSV